MKNLYYSSLSRIVIAICGMGIILSCAPTLRVPVTRPAEINLKGIDKIAIGEIMGTGSADLQEELTMALFESQRFEVLDRQHLEKIFEELKLTFTGVIDENTAVELGKLLGSSAFVFGRVSNHSYSENTTYDDWKDKKGNSHRSYERKGIANVSVSLQVTDLTTGKIVAIKKIDESSSDEKRETDKTPEGIDSNGLLRNARGKVIGIFMKSIAPYTVYESVKLLTDKKLPDLQAGINMAKIGDWDKAVEIFQKATNDFPEMSITHYNLGVAYEYTWNFDKAEIELKKAYELEAKKQYMDELTRCRRLALERKKLEEQLKEK